jgi:hypothetical protein
MKTFQQLYESWSPEDYEKYLGPNFDPLDRGSGNKSSSDGWKLPKNIDDLHSAAWAYFKDIYLPQHYNLSEKECEDIATIIANALWSGYMVARN